MKNQINRLLFICLAIGLLGSAVIVDPTRPPEFTDTLAANLGINKQSLTVTAIFIYPDDRFAIINNQMARVGTKLDDFTITAITPYTVQMIDQEGKGKTLELISNAVKQPTE